MGGRKAGRRRYYDPGTNPQPRRLVARPAARARRDTARPRLDGADTARLEAAEAKRARKADRRVALAPGEVRHG